MKKNWKRFFTLNRAAEGFTLVELIVVIAILAILAAVAVPAYTGYINKAQMSNDHTLVGEVSTALQLQYFADSKSGSGYVVLTVDGASAGGCGTDAMEAAFGSNWAENCTLSYDGWEDDGLLAQVLNGTASTVANSSYLQNASTAELLGTVNTLTNAAANAISKATDVNASLKNMLGEDFVTALEETGVSSDDPNYNTVVSNLMVTYLANEFTGDGSNSSKASGLAATYASMYAYAMTTESGAAEMEEVNKALADAEDYDGLLAALEFSEEFQAGYAEYQLTDAYQSDFSAFLSIMGAVDASSDKFTDMTNADLYTSDQTVKLLGSYTNAVNAISGLNLTTEQCNEILNAVKAGAVVVLVTGTGETAAFPVDADPAA